MPTRALALLALALALAAGCARQSDLALGNLPDSDLAALVDSDAARQLLAELLTRRSSGSRSAEAMTDTRRRNFAGAGEPVDIPAASRSGAPA
jgi:hypothetical protein